jgi:hypothetical protein
VGLARPAAQPGKWVSKLAVLFVGLGGFGRVSLGLLDLGGVTHAEQLESIDSAAGR